MQFRQAARRLLCLPSFTLTILAVFSLGIGGNVAVFSLLDSIFLHPAGFNSPETLVTPRVKYTKLRFQSFSLSDPDFADVLDGREYFSSSTAILSTSFIYRDTTTTKHVEAARVTGQFFNVLATYPSLGRSFRDDDDLNRRHVAILSDAIWRVQFGADPHAIGRNIYLDDERYEIVGVMPPVFAFPRQAELWVPMARSYTSFRSGDRYDENLLVVARLRPGATTPQADSWLRAVSQRVLVNDEEARVEGWTMFVLPFLDFNNQGLRTQFTILAGALLFVFLIACSNIVSLMLARTARQSSEYAVRLALGAGRFDILKLCLSESILLCAVGGSLGLLLGNWAAHLFLAHGPVALTQGFTVKLNLFVAIFTVGVAVLACIAFGTLPAVKVICARNLRINANAGTRVSDRQRVRQALIASQIALTLALLIATGLLLRSLTGLRAIDPGFDSHGLTTAQLLLPALRYDNPQKLSAFYQAALSRLQAIPGVKAVAATVAIPFAKRAYSGSFVIVGRPALHGQPWPYGSHNSVSSDYLRTMRARLLRGRFFNPGDRMGTERVAVIDDLLAKKYWPNRDPIGDIIDPGGHPLRIIGVTGHIRQQLDNINENGSYYEPLLQSPAADAAFVARTNDDSRLSAAKIRQALQDVDPTLPVFNVSSMDAWAEQSLTTRQLVARLLQGFALFSLLLAAVGIYGIISFSASQRRAELGIRVALGAQRFDIVRLLASQGLLLAAIGLFSGLALSALLATFVKLKLYAVTPFDTATYLAMAAFLFLISLAASVFPAWLYSGARPHPAAAP